MTRLPPPIPVETLALWLPDIFPDGVAYRGYVIREMSAKTIFTMLYTGAIEGNDVWLRPDQVTKMSDSQAQRTADAERHQWRIESLRPGAMKDVPGRWYAANTREPIRDETLRNGLVALGAVNERTDIPTTSARPRYALAGHFVSLLLALYETVPDAHAAVIARWHDEHLSTSALARIAMQRCAVVAAAAADRIRVGFPNGESRLLRAGPSSVISKAVIEAYAVRFLSEPGVLFLSESGDKVVARDEALARAVGLSLDPSRNLPDIILIDRAIPTRLVFVEVVATDGAIDARRKQALMNLAITAGWRGGDVAFVTAFLDRGGPAFRKLAKDLAWGSFAWFAAEPDCLVEFRGPPGVNRPVSDVVR